MIYDTQELPKSKLDLEYYGADFPVDVLVKRMEKEDFIIPNFQRKYVWKKKQASLFIESLLLGLPTPTLFLAKDKFSHKYLVIDGQQRLKTLQYFYKESFPDQKVFKLQGVVNPFNGLTYSQLSPSDRRTLDNAIIHCIIISENYDSSGIFYIFERLNTTGTSLDSQEIRNAIYHGAFSDLIKELSENKYWKDLCRTGTQQELILRFLALYFDLDNYSGNITNFLNDFMLKNRNLELISKNEIQNTFINTIELLKKCIGSDTFYHRKSLNNRESFNLVLYESLMILTARKLTEGLDCPKLNKFYEVLIKDNEFWSLAKDPATSRKNVLSRLNYVDELYRSMY